MMNLEKAVQILRDNDHSNRAILCNLNREYFPYDNEELVKAYLFLQEKYLTLNDKEYDKLVYFLYNFPNSESGQ